jgi:hypothetical protein
MTCAATAQFSDAYAPETWTITGAGLGGSSATFTPDGSRLTLVGSDGGFGSTVKATHTVLADATWSFSWSWFTVDANAGFDVGYYTINGTKFFLSDAFSGSGTVSVPVFAGQTIGWQVVSVDGIFGPGNLIINNFQIPGPGVVVLVGLPGLFASRRRE